MELIRTAYLYFFPALLVMLVVMVAAITCRRGKKLAPHHIIGCVLFSTCAVFIPIGTLSIADYILSALPSVSIGSTTLVSLLLWNRLGAPPLLDDREISVLSLWNLLVSAILFVASVGIIDIDLYAAGYGFSYLFILLGLITGILAIRGSRLTWIFLAYIAAFNITLLPSANLFDYVTDGYCFIMSACVLVSSTTRLLSTARTQALPRKQTCASNQQGPGATA